MVAREQGPARLPGSMLSVQLLWEQGPCTEWAVCSRWVSSCVWARREESCDSDGERITKETGDSSKIPS